MGASERVSRKAKDNDNDDRNVVMLLAVVEWNGVDCWVRSGAEDAERSRGQLS